MKTRRNHIPKTYEVKFSEFALKDHIADRASISYMYAIVEAFSPEEAYSQLEIRERSNKKRNIRESNGRIFNEIIDVYPYNRQRGFLLDVNTMEFKDWDEVCL